jgi:hypothetical protein
LEDDWNLGKGLNGPTPFTVQLSPTSNQPEAHPGWPSFSSVPGRGHRAAHHLPISRPRFRSTDSPMCAAIAHPYPVHTSKQRRSHSHHASLHCRLCPARTQPAATLCAALPLLSSVSCRLEPPSRLCSVNNLRQMKLHPRVEPLRHREGPKLIDAIHFPCHGCPIVDSSLHPPSGPDSTSTSFTPAHSSSLARQTPPSTAPTVNRSRASPAAHLPPWSVFFSDFPPSIAQNQSLRLWHPPRPLPPSPLAADHRELAGAATPRHGSSPCSPFPCFRLGLLAQLKLGRPVVAQQEQCLLSFSYGFNLNQIQ